MKEQRNGSCDRLHRRPEVSPFMMMKKLYGMTRTGMGLEQLKMNRPWNY